MKKRREQNKTNIQPGEAKMKQCQHNNEEEKRTKQKQTNKQTYIHPASQPGEAKMKQCQHNNGEENKTKQTNIHPARRG